MTRALSGSALDVARALTVLLLAIFGFFYLQSRFALHYVAPAMILPIVVCWRLAPAGDRRFQPVLGVLCRASRHDGAPAYVLVRTDQPGPVGYVSVAANRRGQLFVLDSAALATHRGIRSRGGGIGRLYRIPKSTLFGS